MSRRNSCARTAIWSGWAAATEPALAEITRRGAASRREDARRLVEAMGLTEEAAADILWALLDGSLYEQLARERGWGDERFAEWFGEALVRLLLA